MQQHLAQLDDAAFERFMQQVLHDVAAERRAAMAWRLPTLVAPADAAAETIAA